MNPMLWAGSFVLGAVLASAGLAAEADGVTPTAAERYAWESVPIVGGGFVTGLIPHPGEAGLIYARTDVGGAYRWDTGEQRWTPLTDWISQEDWTLTGIESLAIDPTDPDRVYVAAGTYTNDWSGPGAILRSRDRGATWDRVDLPFKNGGNEPGRSNGERLVVDPNSPNVLYFGTRSAGLQRSADHGRTWRGVASFPAAATSDDAAWGEGVWRRPIGIVVVLVDEGSGSPGQPSPVLYAAVSTPDLSVYRSSNAGETWQAVPGQPTGQRPIQMKQDADGAIYLTYADAPGPNGMTDGAVWKYHPADGAWRDISPLHPGDDDRFGYAGLALDVQAPGTLMVSTMDRWARGDDLFRSTDGGATWAAIREHARINVDAAPWLTWGREQAGFGHWIGDLEIDPHDRDHVLFVTGTGVRAAHDITAADRHEPTHWRAAAVGIEECVVNDLVSPPSGAPLLSVMWDIDGFRHDTLDASPTAGFFKPNHGRNSDIDYAAQNPDIVVRVHERGTHGSYSLDNGRTWTDWPTAPARRGLGHVAVSADGAVFLSVPGGHGGFVSRDRGQTWASVAGLPEDARVTASPRDPQRFHAVGGGQAWLSTDGGASFTPTGAAVDVGDLLAGTDEAGCLLLANAKGLHHSTDGGKSWRRLPGITSASKVGMGKAAPGAEHAAIFVVGRLGPTYGFFRSDDAGQTWLRINDDAHQFAHVNAITGDPRVHGRVYVGSASRGILQGEPTGHE